MSISGETQCVYPHMWTIYYSAMKRSEALILAAMLTELENKRLSERSQIQKGRV